MNKNVFAYIAFNLLLINLIGFDSPLLQNIISLICIGGVLTVGLAHGAIDNILAVGEDRSKQQIFILKYLLAATGFIVLWVFLPNITFVCFLLVSGYHFGQSQFVEYGSTNKLLNKLLYLNWGLMILFMVFYFNHEQLLLFSQNSLSDIEVFPWLINNSLVIALGLACIVFSSLIYFLVKGEIILSSIFQEFYLVALITISFYLFDTIIGFSLFFLFIHSMRVLQQEFEFCREKMSVKSLYSFVKLFFPLTFASIFGIGAVVFLSYYLGAQHMIPYILIVMLSSFTIPHSFVMDKFYS